jgi:arginase
MRSIGLVGVPSNSSGTTDGVARSPTALRRAGLVEALQRVVDLRDYGDVALPHPSPERDADTHLIDPGGFARLVPLVRDAVGAVLRDGRFPVVVGGDCPLLLGCVLAVRGDNRPGLLFVDGHEDGYLPAESSTGETADMELAFAFGIADASWSPELAALLPVVEPADTRILGPRDAETLQEEGVASLGDRVPLVDGEALLRDPAGVTERACTSLPRPWWFHIDLDVLSTHALPAIDYPQPGGLDWDALLSLARTALSQDPAGLDVTIYNPDLDPEGAHAHRIIRFLVTALGGA